MSAAAEDLPGGALLREAMAGSPWATGYHATYSEPRWRGREVLTLREDPPRHRAAQLHALVLGAGALGPREGRRRSGLSRRSSRRSEIAAPPARPGPGRWLCLSRSPPHPTTETPETGPPRRSSLAAWRRWCRRSMSRCRASPVRASENLRKLGHPGGGYEPEHSLPGGRWGRERGHRSRPGSRGRRAFGEPLGRGGRAPRRGAPRSRRRGRRAQPASPHRRRGRGPERRPAASLLPGWAPARARPGRPDPGPLLRRPGRQRPRGVRCRRHRGGSRGDPLRARGLRRDDLPRARAGRPGVGLVPGGVSAF